MSRIENSDCRKAFREFFRAVRRLSKDPWSAERARQFRAGYRSANQRFSSYEGWQRRVPGQDVAEELKAMAGAACSVVRYGLAQIGVGGGNPIGRYRRLARRYSVPRRSPARYRKALAGLRARLPERSDVPDDEFGDRALANAMTKPDDRGEGPLAKIALVILDGSSTVEAVIDAAYALVLRAKTGAKRVDKVRDLVVPDGFVGDVAFNVWLDRILDLYTLISRRKLTTSIIKPGARDEGKPSGPLVRFLAAAHAPLAIRMRLLNEADRTRLQISLRDLGEDEQNRRLTNFRPLFPQWLVEISPAGWRSRIKTARQYSPPKTNDQESCQPAQKPI